MAKSHTVEIASSEIPLKKCAVRLESRVTAAPQRAADSKARWAGDTYEYAGSPWFSFFFASSDR